MAVFNNLLVNCPVDCTFLLDTDFTKRQRNFLIDTLVIDIDVNNYWISSMFKSLNGERFSVLFILKGHIFRTFCFSHADNNATQSSAEV